MQHECAAGAFLSILLRNLLRISFFMKGFDESLREGSTTRRTRVKSLREIRFGHNFSLRQYILGARRRRRAEARTVRIVNSSYSYT